MGESVYFWLFFGAVLIGLVWALWPPVGPADPMGALVKAIKEVFPEQPNV
jgi:hypothetical protein